MPSVSLHSAFWPGSEDPISSHWHLRWTNFIGKLRIVEGAYSVRERLKDRTRHGISGYTNSSCPPLNVQAVLSLLPLVASLLQYNPLISGVPLTLVFQSLSFHSQWMKHQHVPNGSAKTMFLITPTYSSLALGVGNSSHLAANLGGGSV